MDVVPQLDPKFSNTRWIVRRTSSNLSRCKTKKSVDKYFAFGSHQRLCQETNLVPPWTCTFAVVKDQVLGCLTRIFFRPGMRHFHIWRTWRPRNHVMRYKKTYKSALPTSTSMAQQHCNFTTNCHQVSAEVKVKKMKESMTTTNLTPRINRISSISLIELTSHTASC
jgi:hypothetical protein